MRAGGVLCYNAIYQQVTVKHLTLQKACCGALRAGGPARDCPVRRGRWRGTQGVLRGRGVGREEKNKKFPPGAGVKILGKIGGSAERSPARLRGAAAGELADLTVPCGSPAHSGSVAAA